ncbi:MAG: hypothetical protein RLY17_321 [Pseudomonadota bacterium]|jgi:2',3'-cyclic-nucleotide 2'-phosphodiesterase/3'-nucleotidase
MVQEGKKRESSIMRTSDLQGAFVPWGEALGSKNIAGSLSQIAIKVQNIRAEQPNLVLADARDIIQDNFVESFKNEPASPMILGCNALKYNAWMMGN